MSHSSSGTAEAQAVAVLALMLKCTFCFRSSAVTNLVSLGGMYCLRKDSALRCKLSCSLSIQLGCGCSSAASAWALYEAPELLDLILTSDEAKVEPRDEVQTKSTRYSQAGIMISWRQPFSSVAFFRSKRQANCELVSMKATRMYEDNKLAAPSQLCRTLQMNFASQDQNRSTVTVHTC